MKQDEFLNQKLSECDVVDLARGILSKIKENSEVAKRPNRQEIFEFVKDLWNKSNYLINDPLELDGHLIKIKLPVCNKTWTFLVWDIVKKVVEKYPDTYPYHFANHGLIQYISVSSY